MKKGDKCIQFLCTYTSVCIYLCTYLDKYIHIYIYSCFYRKNIHSIDGREEFFNLMIKNIENNEKRKKLIRSSVNSTERDLMTLLCVFSAYLVSSQDGEYR
jgi:hypothetical protein